MIEATYTQQSGKSKNPQYYSCGKTFATRNFPLQSTSLCHFRYQFGRLLTRMLTQSQWGYAATSEPQAHVEHFFEDFGRAIMPSRRSPKALVRR
jgi:hypothetical protein